MDMKLPLVSIIIPTYNRAQLLARAVGSVLSQSYQCFELLIVDDGSNDNTQEVVSCFKDSRIRYFKMEKNKGASAARNFGMRESRGGYLSFLDSDDEWLPRKLETEVCFLENNKNYIIVSMGTVFIRDSAQQKLYASPEKECAITQDNVLRYRGLTNDFTVIKDSIIRINGFDEEAFARQDFDFWIRITSQGSGYYCPAFLTRHYVMREDQISFGVDRKFEGTMRLSEKYKDLFLADAFAYKQLNIELGMMALIKHDRCASRFFQDAYGKERKLFGKLRLAFVMLCLRFPWGFGRQLIIGIYRRMHPDNYLFWGESDR